MEEVIKKLSEVEAGTAGINIFSTERNRLAGSFNGGMTVPLASAAKVAIGFIVAKCVEEKRFNWNSIVEDVSFNPAEDSNELYPHFQHRTSLQLQEAVEVMIACHDSCVANRIVAFGGGWRTVNQTIQTHFPSINVTENPRDLGNKGQLDQILDMMIQIYRGYINNPPVWTPIINGLVRQKGSIPGIHSFHLNHMTGGLKNAIVDVGLLGKFSDHPFIFALGAIDLPNRNNDQTADQKVMNALKLLYSEYTKGRVF